MENAYSNWNNHLQTANQALAIIHDTMEKVDLFGIVLTSSDLGDGDEKSLIYKL